MTSSKKVLALILIICLIVTLVPATVGFAEGAEPEKPADIVEIISVTPLATEIATQKIVVDDTTTIPTLADKISATVKTTTHTTQNEDGTWQTTSSEETEELAVTYALAEGSTFATTEPAQFIYTATLADNTLTLAQGVALPQITVDVVAKVAEQPGDPKQPEPEQAPPAVKTITEIADPTPIEIELNQEITEQVLLATFPTELSATVDGVQEDVAVVAWKFVFSSTNTPFATAVKAEYYYEPTLAEGYTLSSEIFSPSQKVQVGEALVHNPTPASTGDFSVVGGTINDDYTFGANSAGIDVLTIKSDKELIISGTTLSDVIVIEDGITANITLNDLNIDVNNSADVCAFEIAGTATANIKLVGTNALKSGIREAGLQVTSGATLTIVQESTGSLEVSGGNRAAGIGGSVGNSGGTVNIHGGSIVATGGASGAGIGSGAFLLTDTIERTGGKITITGGGVVASNLGYAAGIGGGAYCQGAEVIISGGVVYATDKDADGIGGGFSSNGQNGTFSTTGSAGNTGNAYIFASSIGDKTHLDSWSGIIFEGDLGKVYGDVTVTNVFTLPSGKTLEVPTDGKITVPSGKQINIEAGAIMNIATTGGVENNGEIFNYGTINTAEKITGSGAIYPIAGNENPVVSVGATEYYLRLDGTNKQFSYDNSNWEKYTGTVTIKGSTTENQVTIFSGEHDIIFDNLSMLMSNRNTSPFRIENSGVANITLKGDNKLSSFGYAGTLEFTYPATLTITKESTGSLEAVSKGTGAAIGGDNEEIGGIVNIYGGIIKAIAEENGAGIGGANGKEGGIVNIYGGSVEASSVLGMSIGAGESRFDNPGSINYIKPTGNVNSIQILAGGDAANTTAYKTTDEYYKNKYVKIDIQEVVPTVNLGQALMYSGAEQTQTVASVMLGSVALDANTEYTLSNNKATNVGDYELTANVNIDGSGKYDDVQKVTYLGESSVTQKFSIAKAQISIASAAAKNKTYDGTSVAAVDVVFSGQGDVSSLLPGKDYTVSANFASANAGNNIAVSGTVTLQNDSYELNNSALPSGVSANILQKPIDSANVILGVALVATGQEQTQTVSSVVVDGVKLVENVDYVVSGNVVTNAGDYTLTITGKGNYGGSIAKAFTVTSASTGGGTLPYQPGGVVDPGGSEVPGGNSIIISPLPSEKQQEDLEKLTDYAEKNNISGTVTFLEDITMKDANGNEVQPSGNNTKIRIDVPGLTTKDTVTVLHIKDDGSVEQILPVWVYMGYVEFYPTSFSTYSVIVHKYVEPSVDTSVSYTSPKTGQ